MTGVKTTININENLWKRFSHQVIEEKGYRKKNEVIEGFIKDYLKKKGDKADINIKKAIILAAGVGSRLRPLTDTTPECLIKINSKTILEHQIHNLKQAGIKEIYMVVGHKSNKIKKFCKENSLKVNFIENKDYVNSNNLFSLWLAKKKFDGGFVCLNSDVLFDIKILEELLKQEGDICLAVDKKVCDEEDTKVQVKNELITKISKEMPKDDVYGEFIGIVKFSEIGTNKLIEILEDLPIDLKKLGDVKFGIQKMINKGHNIYFHEIRKKFWKEIDFIEDLNEARIQKW